MTRLKGRRSGTTFRAEERREPEAVRRKMYALSFRN